MDPGVFLDRKWFEIEVDDCTKDSDDNEKDVAEVYSKVVKIYCAH